MSKNINRAHLNSRANTSTSGHACIAKTDLALIANAIRKATRRPITEDGVVLWDDIVSPPIKNLGRKLAQAYKLRLWQAEALAVYVLMRDGELAWE
jgi:hypothetical protein